MVLGDRRSRVPSTASHQIAVARITTRPTAAPPPISAENPYDPTDDPRYALLDPAALGAFWVGQWRP